MKTMLKCAALASAVAMAAPALAADPTVLTFEGLGDNEQVLDFYASEGIIFGPDSLALIDADAGGTGNFENNPSGVTVLYFLSGPGAVMNVAAGFDTGFSFFYADQIGFTGSVDVFDGLDGTGNLLASLTLESTPDPYTVFVPIGVEFDGIAQSVVFGGSANFIAFDNITLGAATPGGGIPEPATWAMMIGGMGLAGGALRRRSAIKTTVSFA